MPYVIMDACVDVLDRTCVDNCPVDCIYTGGRSSYIQPDECIECGACEPVCPVEAISFAGNVPADQHWHIADNRLFFETTLDGREAPLGSPEGAHALGTIGADTPAVAAMPARTGA